MTSEQYIFENRITLITALPHCHRHSLAQMMHCLRSHRIIIYTLAFMMLPEKKEDHYRSQPYGSNPTPRSKDPLFYCKPFEQCSTSILISDVQIWYEMGNPWTIMVQGSGTWQPWHISCKRTTQNHDAVSDLQEDDRLQQAFSHACRPPVKPFLWSASSYHQGFNFPRKYCTSIWKEIQCKESCTRISYWFGENWGLRIYFL